VNAPLRLFLVSPALAIRRALAKSLDAESQIVVVGEARSSTQALTRVPAASPDVLLAGAHLTEPNSPDLCRQLRATMPHLQVLMVGVNASLDLMADAVRAGAAGVVPHTIDEPQLLEAIETAASGRTVMSTDTLTDIFRADAEAAQADPLTGLSDLDRELFYLVGDGLTNAEIAAELHLSAGTVRNYVSRLFRKLGVERRAEVVAMATRRGATKEPLDRDGRYPPNP
jgi:two-component system, NarL family, response regulator DevR